MLSKRLHSSLVLVSLIIIMILSIFVSFLSINITARAESLTNYKYEKIVSDMNDLYDSNCSINKIKTINDFDGNEYTLIECEPTGYIIFDDISNQYIEFSAISTSPYLNNDLNNYYAGPKHFYHKSGDKYRNTITNKWLSNIEIKDLKSKSNSMRVKLNSSINQDKELILYENSTDTKATSFTYVSNYRFFTNKVTETQIGYMEYEVGDNVYGLCGYIAASMLLGYYDTFRNSSFVTLDCMTGSGINRHFKNTQLTQELVNIAIDLGKDPAAGTTSTSIRQVMNNYFDKYNVTATSYDMIIPFFSALTLKTRIKNDKPVILFGSLVDPTAGNLIVDLIKHSVIVYGFCRNPSSASNTWGFMSHYGWSGYSMVTINIEHTSLFGSMYNIQSYS